MAKITDEQVKMLKHQHGETLHLVTVETGDAEHEFVFKPVTKDILRAAQAGSRNENMKFAEIIIANTMVHGDAELLENAAIYMAVSQQCEKLLSVRNATIKNL